MAKINILPSEVFNLIAAGEVVERPLSVVKELIENAIDAGATQIQIDIRNGGIGSILVKDNGCGIEKEEIGKVFLPHATSKIKTADDLSKIGTLGFRGEALASIAAVSKVKITSKTKESTLATTIYRDNKSETISESGSAEGTIVEVSDLFYCVPARAKFLKKPKTEEGEITNIISRFILANPKIAFKYTADGKTIYQSTGNGIKEALFAVYGKDAVENTIEVTRTFDKAKITGYIGKPTYSKPNRTYQTLVLNGRYIQNLAVQTAITTAYGDFLMKRQYPFYVIFVDMPLNDVDVNVHPNKMEVRFSSEINIYPMVFETVVRALHQNDYQPENLGSSPLAEKGIEKVERIVPKVVPTPEKVEKSFNNSNLKIESMSNYFLAASKLFDSNRVASSVPFSSDFVKDSFNNVINTESGEVIKNEIDVPSTESQTESPNNTKEQLSFKFAPEYKVVGKLFNTYLIIEQNNDCFFIDQHAMHERILFERLKTQIDNSSVAVQPMLIPHIFNTNAQETNFLCDHLTDFFALGFEIEQFGENSFKISSIPVICADMSVGSFVTAVLSNIKEFIVGKTSELIRDKLASKACKAAVKGGYDLTKEEIDKLISDMQTENTPLRCPHGRPSVVKVSKTEIEKWFKRIV